MSANLSAVRTSPTLVDFGLVESEIRKRIVGEDRSRAFALYVIDSYFGIPSDDAERHTVDGGNDRGVDIIYIDCDRRTINICSCKCVVNFSKSRKNFPGSEINKLITFLDDLLQRNEEVLRNANGSLCSKIREIWSLFEEGEGFKIEVHLFSNQLCLAECERDRLSTALTKYGVKLFEHGLYELCHGLIRAARPRFRKKLRPDKDGSFFFSDKNCNGWQAKISLSNMFEFLLAEDRRSFDERLIAENVRYFLGPENAANDAIRRTLTGVRSGEFWALNNGMTVVCDSVIHCGSGNHALTLINPKIVNGGQTARVIHEVGTETLTKLGDGALAVKIVETRDDSLIERIAIASNTQSRISGRDLKAFDEFQIKLSMGLSELGYFYRRKRGENGDSVNQPVIDMAKSGQVLLAFLRGEPTKSKTSSNEIFGELYEEAFNSTRVTPELIVSANIVNNEIEREKGKALARQRSLSRNSYEETWVIEGNFHILFIVGELMRKRKIPLTNHESGKKLIAEAMTIISKFVERNIGRSNYRLFRLATSRGKLLSILDQTPSGHQQAVQLVLPLNAAE